MKITNILLATFLAFSLLSCQKDLSTNPAEVALTTQDTSNSKLSFTNQEPVYANVDANIGGYTVAKPAGYANNPSKKYPLLISLHGSGELGNGGSDLWKVQHTVVANMLYNGLMPKTFTVNGQKFKLLIITPQFKKFPSVDNVNDIINYAIKHYRVDESRIYLVGTSMGSGVIVKYAFAYPKKIAAVVTCGDPTGPSSTGVRAIAGANLPYWGFHNQEDPLVSSLNTINLVNAINALSPKVKAKKTIFPNVAIHNCWITAMPPSYKENNMNIYQWLLQYRR